ncbi:hypothetical protein [Echinicola sp. 20G]|uniref:hypothetical protein n=1 Tax=Echinicola sp. 20G TaxID=2781961 RepID=UPI00191097CF|nr:hypothetical protein [Echinicola sp. 20G]
MLRLSPSESPFYIANKKYCDSLTFLLDEKDIKYSGSISSYGYDVSFEISYKGRRYHFNYHKHQIYDGIGIRNARNYSYTNFRFDFRLFDIMKINRVFPFEQLLRKAEKHVIDGQFNILLNKNTPKRTLNKLVAFCRTTEVVYLTSSTSSTKCAINNLNLDPWEIIHLVEKHLIQRPAHQAKNRL